VALQGPIRIEAPAGLLWQEGRYGGPFRLLADAHGGWTLLEEVPLERYLEGVVPHEIGAGAPPAALAAQAVLARTWAVKNLIRYSVDGYHLCADTQCQVYSDPGQASASVRAAIAATRGQVLTAAGRPIQAVYHASNGGVAAGLEEAWEVEPVPYLRPFVDGPPAAALRWPLPLAATVLPSLLQGDGGKLQLSDHGRSLRKADPDLPVLLITGHGDIPMAVQAMREGAYDFLAKPYPADRLISSVGRALEKRRVPAGAHALRAGRFRAAV
jgi:CheY-like chemotaxis protein